VLVAVMKKMLEYVYYLAMPHCNVTFEGKAGSSLRPRELNLVVSHPVSLAHLKKNIY